MAMQSDQSSAQLDPTGAAECFRRRMFRDPARPALSFEGETLSYERWGERVVAVTVLKPGTSLTLEELRAFAAPGLARYKLPSELHFVEIVPRNSTGKLLKTELRRRFSGVGSSS